MDMKFLIHIHIHRFHVDIHGYIHVHRCLYLLYTLESCMGTRTCPHPQPFPLFLSHPHMVGHHSRKRNLQIIS